MPDTNRVQVGLTMAHDEGDTTLSSASLDLDYPAIGRNAGNLVQFSATVNVLLGIVKLACNQAVAQYPEDVPLYVGWLQETGEEFAALAQRYAATTVALPPAETAHELPNSSPGVIR